jgi:hypothetical protein
MDRTERHMAGLAAAPAPGGLPKPKPGTLAGAPCAAAQQRLQAAGQ